MPADVSAFEEIRVSAPVIDAAPPRRLPLAVGLMVAATASVGLWVGVAAGLRALFS
ncbi:hypothetical protein [Phenylobacterium sp.]|jgi:hypothetical protein|uniref:hypothetical protein n=1 Tax=Phenylobacterium sp. TaxID=1871053 RepID=UPI002F3F9E90